MTTTKAIASDQHINSTVGLCTPTVNLDDGGTYHASHSQRWLWESWLDYCQRVSAAPGRKIAVLNGDLGELDVKRRSYQLITPNKATIQAMIIDTLEPLLAVVEAVYIVRGTAAHIGKSAWLEEALAKDIDISVPSGMVLDPKTGKQIKSPASWWHIRAVVEGVRVDIAHHASMGGLPWTAPNAANRLAAKTVFQYADKYHQPYPDLVIRSHNHQKADSYKAHSTRAIFTPAWSLATEYAHRGGHENDLADIGGLIITCHDGTYDYTEPVLYRPAESKRIWKLKL